MKNEHPHPACRLNGEGPRRNGDRANSNHTDHKRSLRFGAHCHHLHGRVRTIAEEVVFAVELLEELNAHHQENVPRAAGRQLYREGSSGLLIVGQHLFAGVGLRLGEDALGKVDFRGGDADVVMRTAFGRGDAGAGAHRRNVDQRGAGIPVDGDEVRRIESAVELAGRIEVEALQDEHVAGFYGTFAAEIADISLECAVQLLHQAGGYPFVADALQQGVECSAEYFGRIAGAPEFLTVFPGTLEPGIFSDTFAVEARFLPDFKHAIVLIEREVADGTLDGNDPFLICHDCKFLNVEIPNRFLRRVHWAGP